ncbi:MAG: tRNA (N6-threonylcarbamoyladenosine(37)-N6)-methyltransferase TrmO [Peptococcaceae bacterium]|nr:tRNA (N6-threonylcarbamoyladenosine(37)-N6)-methyltransferase TrmO [Peptococcaceae bacterium]
MHKGQTSDAAEHVQLRVIARARTAFATKFGAPRQSGLVEGLESRIVFEPEFRVREALRGLEGYDYIWALWSFSEAIRDDWSPTVRPPRLGGNVRMGVFATRSPYRPNPLALSSLRLLRIEETADEGCVLVVDGADMMDGTPIYDIKPYLPFTDSHPNARAGFAAEKLADQLAVDFPEALLARLPAHLRRGATRMLAQNPSPHYKHDASRVYGLAFAGFDLRFTIDGAQLTVVDVVSETGDEAP